MTNQCGTLYIITICVLQIGSHAEALNKLVLSSLASALRSYLGGLDEDLVMNLVDSFASSPEQQLFDLDDEPAQNCANCSLRDRIIDIYSMSIPNAFAETSRNPLSLLPFCQRGQRDKVISHCWQKIVNDRGVCFSSPTGKFFQKYICRIFTVFLQTFSG